MWTTVIFSVLIATSLLASLGAIFLGVRCAARVSELRQAWGNFKRLDARSVDERLIEFEGTLLMLANKVKMMKVRGAASHTDRDKTAEPDARSDPERWRVWKNAQLRAGEFNQ